MNHCAKCGQECGKDLLCPQCNRLVFATQDNFDLITTGFATEQTDAETPTKSQQDTTADYKQH